MHTLRVASPHHMLLSCTLNMSSNNSWVQHCVKSDVCVCPCGDDISAIYLWPFTVSVCEYVCVHTDVAYFDVFMHLHEHVSGVK